MALGASAGTDWTVLDALERRESSIVFLSCDELELRSSVVVISCCIGVFFGFKDSASRLKSLLVGMLGMERTESDGCEGGS